MLPRWQRDHRRFTVALQVLLSFGVCGVSVFVPFAQLWTVPLRFKTISKRTFPNPQLLGAPPHLQQVHRGHLEPLDLSAHPPSLPLSLPAPFLPAVLCSEPLPRFHMQDLIASFEIYFGGQVCAGWSSLVPRSVPGFGSQSSGANPLWYRNLSGLPGAGDELLPASK